MHTTILLNIDQALTISVENGQIVLDFTDPCYPLGGFVSKTNPMAIRRMIEELSTAVEKLDPT